MPSPVGIFQTHWNGPVPDVRPYKEARCTWTGAENPPPRVDIFSPNSSRLDTGQFPPPFLHGVGHSHHHHPSIYNIKRSTINAYTKLIKVDRLGSEVRVSPSLQIFALTALGGEGNCPGGMSYTRLSNKAASPGSTDRQLLLHIACRLKYIRPRSPFGSRAFRFFTPHGSGTPCLCAFANLSQFLLLNSTSRLTFSS